MKKILLITPPLLQPNAPYPATPYLAGYLTSKGFTAAQADLSTELLDVVFSGGFLREAFDAWQGGGSDNIRRMHALRGMYISTIDSVMSFLRGGDPSLANLICRPDFLPQAAWLDAADGLEESFGALGVQDCARYLSTLYLQDISDFLRETVSAHFGMVKYAESIALSLPDFGALEDELALPPNIIECRMTALLDAWMEREKPGVVGFTVPFPGNLLSALRCAQHIKLRYPGVLTVMGGGYPSTELRDMSDKRIFAYFDYVVLDGGEVALEKILSGLEPVNAYSAGGFCGGREDVSHAEYPCPDFGPLPHKLYFSLFGRANPMHRLWSDGRWNKMMLAHGCYWGKCSFCDTSLDYICRYEAMPAARIADHMEAVAAQTGSTGFHFVDEAAPPRLLRDLSLELLRRGRRYSWWTNIRFESAFTGDLCRLMATAGCIAVSGGLEAASDRLLALVNKGVSTEQATLATRNFFYAGIMAHAYLMYGLPGQTLQESVDSLETVRQMFRAQLIDSAYWHRYAMTMHSPMGADPSQWGVKRKSNALNALANNEVYFAENRGYNINIVGDGLREALDNYLAGAGLERPAHKWFACKAPATTVDPGLITDHLIKPDGSRLFNPLARLVWLGAPVSRTAEGISIETASESKELKFSPSDAVFMQDITRMAADLDRKLTFAEVKEIYGKSNEKPFAELYHSKKWDKMREYGLLQI